MQLEEMQQRWQQLDQKLDHLAELGSTLAHQVIVQPARRRVTRLALWPSIDIGFSVCLLILGIQFLRGHGQRLELLGPACTAMLGALGLLISSMLQLQLLSTLDWTGPVANIQASLHRLRVARIRQFKWIILLAPLMGFSAFLVGVYWVIDTVSQGRADILEKLPASWVIANYVFGVLFIPVGYYVARALARHCKNHRWWQAVLNDIAGHSLQAAVQDVRRWDGLLKANGVK